jgi:hypothetical protein
MPATSAIHEFLREAHVGYTVLPHRPAYTAQEEAAAVHIAGRDWAKVVIRRNPHRGDSDAMD